MLLIWNIKIHSTLSYEMTFMKLLPNFNKLIKPVQWTRLLFTDMSNKNASTIGVQFI